MMSERKILHVVVCGDTPPKALQEGQPIRQFQGVVVRIGRHQEHFVKQPRQLVADKCAHRLHSMT